MHRNKARRGNSLFMYFIQTKNLTFTITTEYHLPMLQSMTGFGSAQLNSDSYSLSVEIRSLNSKSLDLTLRLPRFLADKEIEIRNLITKSLQRGKVSLTVELQTKGMAKARSAINTELFTHYYKTLEAAALQVGANTNDIFRIALTMPEVVQTEASADQEAPFAWEQAQELLKEALYNLNHFRTDEGKALSQEIVGYAERIRILLSEIDKHDPERIAAIKTRISGHLQELQSSVKADPNRFEQEMIYYIEKLDIAEEKVRLLNHLHYFFETAYTEEAPGKKLGFIAQEIGREINTIGSKANDSVIQHKVVEMKEELEKIKEQLHNVL